MGALVRTADPVATPVSLAEFIDHARLTGTPEGVLLEGYIGAATAYAEQYLGQALVTQTWQMKLDRWPCASRHNPLGTIPVPRPPLQSVSSVAYLDSAGTSTTMASSDYQVDTVSRPARIGHSVNGYWPTLQTGAVNPVTVTFVAGYGTTVVTASVAAVPKQIKQAILIYTGYLYQERDENAVAPAAVNNLLNLADFGSYRTQYGDEMP